MNTGMDFKNRLFEYFAIVARALSSPKRLEIIDVLCHGERTVETLAKEVAITLANASRHLQILKASHLVEARREGTFIYYRLADDCIKDFWFSLRELGRRRIAEIEQLINAFFKSRDELEPVDRNELLERLKTGRAILIDVRPKEEYLSGHIPGAISIPIKELESRLKELPCDVEIVAYCRGPYCVFSVEAVNILRKNGFSARRLREGIHEWRSLGLPLER